MCTHIHTEKLKLFHVLVKTETRGKPLMHVIINQQQNKTGCISSYMPTAVRIFPIVTLNDLPRGETRVLYPDSEKEREGACFILSDPAVCLVRRQQ